VAASAIVNGKGKADAETYFRSADLHKDNKLSEDEVIEASGRFLPYGILEQAFKQADKNKDSFLVGDGQFDQNFCGIREVLYFSPKFPLFQNSIR
jgi:hypothetical protein